MPIPVTSRFAGKALGDFLSTVGGMVSEPVEQAILNKMRGGNLFGPAVAGENTKIAQAVAKLGGAAAPLAVAGTAMAGYNLLAGQGQQAAGAAPKSYRPPAFASSAYIPGSLPMTNEQMGEAMLDQQRFQHQLQLIQARQDASMHRGSLQNSGGDIGSILSLGQKIYG